VLIPWLTHGLKLNGLESDRQADGISRDTGASSDQSHPADIPRSLPFVRVRH